MGYGITTTAIYGVSLNPDQSKKVYAALAELEQGTENQGVRVYVPDVLGRLSASLSHPLGMVAEDTDSRVESTCYEEGYEHSFGVVVAAKGYAGRDTSASFATKLNGNLSAHQAIFAAVVAPILAAAGLTALTPSIVIGSCTD